MKISDFEPKSDLIMSDSENEEILGISSPIYFAYFPLLAYTILTHDKKSVYSLKSSLKNIKIKLTNSRKALHQV